MSFHKFFAIFIIFPMFWHHFHLRPLLMQLYPLLCHILKRIYCTQVLQICFVDCNVCNVWYNLWIVLLWFYLRHHDHSGNYPFYLSLKFSDSVVISSSFLCSIFACFSRLPVELWHSIFHQCFILFLSSFLVLQFLFCKSFLCKYVLPVLFQKCKLNFDKQVFIQKNGKPFIIKNLYDSF